MFMTSLVTVCLLLSGFCDVLDRKAKIHGAGVVVVPAFLLAGMFGLIEFVMLLFMRL